MFQIYKNNSILIKHRKIYKKDPTNCSCNHRNVSFYHKVNIKNIVCRKLLNLNLCAGPFVYSSIKSMPKPLKLLEILKTLRFAGEWMML